MQAIPIHVATRPDRKFYLVMTQAGPFYALVVWYEADYEPFGGHWCGYLNLNRNIPGVKDLKIEPDSVIGFTQITYAGIGAQFMDLPVHLTESIPIELSPDWVGFDMLESPYLPKEEEIVKLLIWLAEAISHGL